MASMVVRVTDASFATNDIVGLRQFTFNLTQDEVRARSDAELGESSADVIQEMLTGTLSTNDEDIDLDGTAAMFVGTAGVLVITGVANGGTAVTITIGLAADATGVVFQRVTETVGQQTGRPPELTFDWAAKYHEDHTKTWGSAAEVAAGTALMSVVFA